MFKKLAVGVAVILLASLAVVLDLAATKPDTIHVVRSTSIGAPPEEVFALINDFRRWSDWSPYEKLDPEMKRTYSGASSGEGAVYEWDGDGQVGAGRMEITEATAPSQVDIQLNFLRPMEGRNAAEFTLKPAGQGSEVSWSMRGPRPFVTKVMCIFIDLDHMIGKDFEVGLANLKAIAEQ